jgi:hypothetical protein
MRLPIAVLLLAATSPALAWDSCEFRAERRVMLDAADLRSLVLRAGAGELEVVGEDGRAAIEAIGTACASSEERLAAIRLDSGRDGDVARLTAVLPETSGWGWGGGDYASLALVVRVPRALGVDAEDSSGDASFDGFASLAVIDSSGDLRIANIAGAVAVADSSGDLDIRDVGGPATVRADSSGDIDILRVAGDVGIERDSSGDITIREVNGAVRIGSDGSGDIVIEQVGGDAEIGSDGSGSIRARRIAGDFTVGADGSGGISTDEINGRVSVPAD